MTGVLCTVYGAQVYFADGSLMRAIFLESQNPTPYTHGDIEDLFYTTRGFPLRKNPIAVYEPWFRTARFNYTPSLGISKLYLKWDYYKWKGFVCISRTCHKRRRGGLWPISPLFYRYSKLRYIVHMCGLKSRQDRSSIAAWMKMTSWQKWRHKCAPNCIHFDEKADFDALFELYT